MIGHNQLIGVALVLLITAAGVYVIYDVVHSHQQAAARTVFDRRQNAQAGGLVLTNVIADNITNDGVKYVRIQVKYTGSDKLPLNDSFIQLRTKKGIADLAYRDGILERSQAEGFYTVDK